MAKLLVLVGIIAIVYFLFVKKRVKNSADKDSVRENEMVACAKCGDIISSDEAIWAKGKWFCSAKCLEAK